MKQSAENSLTVKLNLTHKNHAFSKCTFNSSYTKLLLSDFQ